MGEGKEIAAAEKREVDRQIHQELRSGNWFIPAADIYETPEMVVLVMDMPGVCFDCANVSIIDDELVESITKAISLETSLEMVLVANDQEHSLEIELPFLQITLNNSFSILPLMVRTVNPQEAADVARIIVNLVKDKKVLVVASTDLSHFYPEQNADKLDNEMLNQIQTFSINNVFQSELNGTGFACGLGAVMVSMEICKTLRADNIKILHHSTSGKMTGDFTSVVGYGAGVFIKSK